MVMLAAASDQNWKSSEFGIIPADWSVHQISDFKPFITSGSRGWAKYYAEAGAPFIRITNLSHDDIYPDLRDLRFVQVAQADPEAKRTQLEAGDILISITADIGAIGYVGTGIPRPSYINQHIACVRLPQEVVDSKYAAYFLASTLAQERFAALLDVGAKTGLNLKTVGQLKILCPPLLEQREIAKSLSDIDRWIKSLNALLSKKRAMRRGALSDLLTGARRLPGFGLPEPSKAGVTGYQQTETGRIPSDWKIRPIEEIAAIGTGQKNTQDRVDDGRYPFFVRSQQIERIDTFSFDGEAVLTAGDGVGTGKVFHYINGKCDIHQRVYRISNFDLGVNGYYFFLFFSTYFYSRIMQMTAKSSVDSVRREMISRMAIALPSRSEQDAIAAVLKDMEDEIAQLERELAKAHHLKSGAMQELLTGRVRLA